MLRVHRIGASVLALTFSAGLGAQAGLSDLDRLVVRELANSQVRSHLFQLTDAIGPRVVGSPALESSRRWVEGRLKEYGLESIHREENAPMEVGPGVMWAPLGWSWSRLVVQQMTPWPATLIAVPVLYSPGTGGPVVGEAAIAPLPALDAAAVASFEAKYRGALKGRFLLASDAERALAEGAGPRYHRYSDAEMREFESASPAKAMPGPGGSPAPDRVKSANKPPSFEETLALHNRIHGFLKREGVLGIIGAARGTGGTLFVRPPAAPPGLVEDSPPTLDLAAEHFNRILRLVKNGIPVRLEVDLRSEFHQSGTTNLLAELPGSDKRDEIVLVGAHLDSWHGGTGATDNAVNVAVLLETARILGSTRMAPRRTIRFAFWDGEELGTLGSRGYVARHLVNLKSGAKGPEFEKTSCYFNLDYGAGRIRGVYLQGRIELQPIFAEWLRSVEGEHLVASARTTLGSDQASFERAGVPGISFIQDPLNYEERTHHTTMDVPDYVSVDDLNHGVRVLANVLMKAADAAEKLPRQPPAH